MGARLFSVHLCGAQEHETACAAAARGSRQRERLVDVVVQERGIVVVRVHARRKVEHGRVLEVGGAELLGPVGRAHAQAPLGHFEVSHERAAHEARGARYQRPLKRNGHPPRDARLRFLEAGRQELAITGRWPEPWRSR